MSEDKGNVIQYLFTIDGLGQIVNRKNFISDFTFRTEINIRIFSAGGSDLIQFNFFQCTLTAGSLLGFTCICRETGNKFLQLLDLFFLFLVGFLHLLDQQLAGFIPEIVVSGIELDLAIVDVCGMGTYLI